MLISPLSAIYIGLASGALIPTALQTQSLQPVRYQADRYQTDRYQADIYFSSPSLNDKSSAFTTIASPSVSRQKQPIANLTKTFSIKNKRVKKRRKEGQWRIFRAWISSDITRLFVPNLQKLGQLNLHLRYGLKRSPYLLLRYEELTIKTKLKSNGMLQNEIYYNLGIKDARLGIKIRHRDPHLYFRYRF